MRKQLTLLLFAMFMILGIAQPVKASDSQTQITKQTSRLINACKKYNLNEAKKCIDMNNKSNKFYVITSNSWNKYIKKNQKHISASIEAIEITGKTAKVKLNVIAMDNYTPIKEGIGKQFRKAEPFNTKKVDKYVTNNLKKASTNWKQYQKEYSMTLVFKNISGKWLLKSITKPMLWMYDGGATEALRDFKEDPFSFW